MIKKENVEFRKRNNQLAQTLGIKYEKIEEGRACCILEAKDHILNPYKIVQGGALVSLADASMAGACIYLDEAITTIDIQYHFLGPAKSGDEILCEAKEVNVGRKILTLEAKIFVDDKVIGLATGTFYRLGSPLIPEDKEENPDS